MPAPGFELWFPRTESFSLTLADPFALNRPCTGLDVIIEGPLLLSHVHAHNLDYNGYFTHRTLPPTKFVLGQQASANNSTGDRYSSKTG